MLEFHPLSSFTMYIKSDIYLIRGEFGSCCGYDGRPPPRLYFTALGGFAISP